MENLKLDSFLEYKFLSNLDFNPDGSNLAFSLSEADLENNSYKHFIYNLDTKNKEIKKLTHSGKEKNSLWLNNNTILFSADRDKDIEEKKKLGETWTIFYALDIKNGGEAYEYMKLPVNVTEIKIIDENNFILTADFDNNSLNLNDLKGGEREKAIKQIEENKDYEVLDEIPFWSNGNGFRNKKRNRLYHFDKSNNKLTPISDEYTNVESFNIKENKVIFVGRTYKDKQALTAGLYTYDVKSNKLETIISDNLYDISYANFIEDKIICALSDMKEYGINENHKIYLIDNKNISLLYDNDTWLTCTVGSDCRLGGGKSFKVIGNKLYFLSTIADSVHLSSLDTNGKIEILCSENGSIDFFDIANNEIYYVGMRNYTLQEIYKLENNSSIKLSSFNDEINKKYKISKPEVFDFTTNGDKTKGFVIYPIDYDKNKTYPAILDIHGGPKTAYGDVYYHEMQVWANMGYFVIFTNPHGSDGYGNKFADIRGKYGTIDYKDLMNFTDYVLEKYPIDKSRVGVTGGSYGGYMTNWIIGHTDRFKCAASQRSISNWISKFGTTDIGYYFNADQNQATPWINHDKLWWHSPLKYADKAKTPTLFIHSEEDYRCWLAEGLQMFTALKYHGIEARLCMFRGENHELSRSGKPKHRIRRLTEITNWFEKYLK
ncbi:S9 family peptidase (plasmid) [Fusobacterium vincentii]|uniref:alpha/beta hydrolase family protein n=1 Tax=Fusobacterium TaxID=848 RepID=UPI001EEDAC8C|nr:S9 family peptidase [Fusobacterium nucleatum]MCG6835977.1 S9 family peptidase [Fusobacterium nucleatum]